MHVLRSVVALSSAIVLAGSLSAQSRVQVKLATLLPANSLWGKALSQMTAEWTKGTDGRVAANIFPGGSQGDDGRVMQKMRVGALQAAALTTGLGRIDDAFNVFGIPFFFESYDELAHVIDALAPELKQRLEAKGFVLLNWGYGGWAHVFTRTGVKTVSDLKRTRVFTAMGDDRMAQLYTRNGFTPQALAPTDIPTGLKTGMIDALPTTPLAALSFQWYADVPFMLDVALAPAVGGTVITTRAWNAISETDRAVVLAAAARVEQRLFASVPSQDRDAVEQMKTRGLTVVPVDAQSAEWQGIASAFATSMRGTMVPDDILDMATDARGAFRAKRGAQ